MWTGLADFLDRLPALFGKMAFPFLVIGAALEVALRGELIPANAWNGRVADTAPIIWVVGLALAIVWIGIKLTSLPLKLRQWKATVAHRDQVRKNLVFLDPKARLLLYFIVRYQGGRTPSLSGIPSFDTLRSFGALDLEREFIHAFVESAGTYRVSPLLGEQETLLERLTPGLETHFKVDLNNPDVLAITLRLSIFGR
ncbi:hypothetical protein [Neorhizobium sp. DAR64860/K0K1]|uniref:hypothetical protein n=1 Tax=Neorhizobium sp. DAR64860/K0K1 TaxID=3421955 RepID=UPI003D2B30B2